MTHINIKKNSRPVLFIFSLVLVTLLLSGCIATSIKNVKNPDRVGDTVIVSGTVQNTMKIGELSGFTLEDKTDTISVSSESLPKEGTRTTVKGTLMKDALFGYYIKVS